MGKRKCATISGARKRMTVQCPHCGKTKTIEYRKTGRVRKIFGATEVDKPRQAGL